MCKQIRITAVLVVILLSGALYGTEKSVPSPAQATVPHDPQRATPIAVQRLIGPIILDGASDEPAWKAATSFIMVQHAPNFLSPPSDRTEVLVGFDDESLYVAARLFDSEPKKIQASTKKKRHHEPQQRLVRHHL